MKRPVKSDRFCCNSNQQPRGFTLVEILVATALTLVMITAVVSIFGQIGDSVNKSRATLEMTDRLRAAVARLGLDLSGTTVTVLPPRRPEAGEGYKEIIEGPNTAEANIAVDEGGALDQTVGDFDDILMFTAHGTGRPFAGLCAGAPIESDVAEIAWFVRGNTLYRRVLLVAPEAPISTDPGGYFANNDVSVRNVGGIMVANTLGDLSKRECRFAHHPTAFPFDARGWGLLGLPTLRECSSANWIAGGMAPEAKTAAKIDFWRNPHPWATTDDEKLSGTRDEYSDGQRFAEDAILTNVIGFDVKVWDPEAGTYVDLGSGAGRFGGNGDARSGLNSSAYRVYDTWSLHYEHDGIDQDGRLGVDQGTNGFDDDGSGGVDDAGERETAPPYPFPLRGIQVKIRVFEPDSRQVREVTVVQDFLSK